MSSKQWSDVLQTGCPVFGRIYEVVRRDGQFLTVLRLDGVDQRSYVLNPVQEGDDRFVAECTGCSTGKNAISDGKLGNGKSTMRLQLNSGRAGEASTGLNSYRRIWR